MLLFAVKLVIFFENGDLLSGFPTCTVFEVPRSFFLSLVSLDQRKLVRNCAGLHAPRCPESTRT